MTTIQEEWVWVPFEVDKKFDGYRIDRFLASRLAFYTRGRVQKILESARVTRNDQRARASTKVRSGDKICVAYPRAPEPPLSPEAALPILYEDEAFLIVDKPAGLLSHPTDKIVTHTVLGYLRHARLPGTKLHLLHRLDRETSGVLALAKTPSIARQWTRAMERREIQKEYIAFARGQLHPPEGVFDQPMGPENGPIKVRQWINVPLAVPARTRYRLQRVMGPGPTTTPSGRSSPVPSSAGVFSVVLAWPATGRLHQIRVHFAAFGHPLLGDALYTGTGAAFSRQVAGTVIQADRLALGFPRTALHASRLTFSHPLTGESLCVSAPLPSDMANLLDSSSDETPDAEKAARLVELHR